MDPITAATPAPLPSGARREAPQPYRGRGEGAVR